MLCNAFDLVRIHKFGAQDADCPQQEITRRPSYQAMCAFVTGDEACRRAFLAEHLAEVEADFADMADPAQTAPEQAAEGASAPTPTPTPAPTSTPAPTPTPTREENTEWLAELGVNRKTGEADSTIANAALILRNDPTVRR